MSTTAAPDDVARVKRYDAHHHAWDGGRTLAAAARDS